MADWSNFDVQMKAMTVEIGNASRYLNAIWIQSKCKCEYCGIDLLGSPQIFRGAESDHILPKAKYRQLELKLSNYAMACSSCHKLKGRFDPAEDPSMYLDATDLTDEDRFRLIAVVQRYLEPLRTAQDSDIEKIRSARAKLPSASTPRSE